MTTSNAFVLLFEDQNGFQSEVFVSKNALVARLLEMIKAEFGESSEQVDIGKARDHTEDFVRDLDYRLHYLKPEHLADTRWDSSERLRYAEGPIYIG